MIKPFVIPPDRSENLKKRFRSRYPDFTSFTDPGERFVHEELGYKRELLTKFKDAMPEERIRTLLDENKGRQVLEKMVQCSGNLVHFTSWDKTFGKDDETRTAILSVLLETTREPWKGPATLEPLFRCFRLHHRKPDWDALGASLWLFRPEDYFPIKISNFRRFAKEAFDLDLAPGRPQPETFAGIMDFMAAFRSILQEWNPRETTDLQSFVFALATQLNRGMAAPFDDIFDSREQAHEVFGWLRKGMEWLGIHVDGGDDPRAAVTMPLPVGAKKPRRINLVFGSWPMISFIGRQSDDHRLEFVCHKHLVPDAAVLYHEGEYKPLAECHDIGEGKDYVWVRVKLEDMSHEEVWTAAAETMRSASDKFRDWKGSSFRYHHKPEVYAGIIDESQWDALLSSGLPEVEGDDEGDSLPEENTLVTHKPCTLEQAMGDVFMPVETFRKIVSTLKRRKNLILQGAPGTGKTYAARRIAYALMQEQDPGRVKMVQFHQSYGYEDFIQGWRPNESGGFTLHDGHFKRFCQKAQLDQTRPYVFIIDEINRGNLSSIFGELLVLLETDKRGREMALTYSPEDNFMIPPNVYVLGLMNTADRSLAVVDYALRRRFAFATLDPYFDSQAFVEALTAKKVSSGLARRIRLRMEELNRQIANDTERLGLGCRIGHSFFVPMEPVEDEESWYRDVIEWEILPLLEEYWVDLPVRIEQAKEQLLGR